MDKDKRARLEGNGWKVGSLEEFLELKPEEAACIELKLKRSRNAPTPTNWPGGRRRRSKAKKG